LDQEFLQFVAPHGGNLRRDRRWRHGGWNHLAEAEVA
jgi:hypothetical protein